MTTPPTDGVQMSEQQMREMEEAKRVLMKDAATYMKDVAVEYLGTGLTALTAARCNRQAEKIDKFLSTLSPKEPA